MSSQHTPWSQGSTPLAQTLRWTPEQIAAANEQEQCKVFAGGRLVAICERRDDARVIALTPALLTHLQNCAAHLVVVRGRDDPFAQSALALIAKATGRAA